MLSLSSKIFSFSAFIRLLIKLIRSLKHFQVLNLRTVIFNLKIKSIKTSSRLFSFIRICSLSYNSSKLTIFESLIGRTKLLCAFPPLILFNVCWYSFIKAFSLFILSNSCKTLNKITKIRIVSVYFEFIQSLKKLLDSISTAFSHTKPVSLL